MSQNREAHRARQIAEIATLNERQVRLEAVSLRESSDVHMKFVEDLLFATDSYNTRGRSLDVRAMFEAILPSSVSDLETISVTESYYWSLQITQNQICLAWHGVPTRWDLAQLCFWPRSALVVH